MSKTSPSPQPNDTGLLAGLVSPVAEQLYTRLVTHGRLRIGTDEGEMNLDHPAARELAELDLLYGAPHDASLVQAVSTSVALPLLLSRRQQELVAAHERVIRGWGALESLLKADMEESSPRLDSGIDTIELLTDRPSIAALSADLYKAARHELCTTSTGAYTTPLSEHQLLTPPKSALLNGARYRNIYDQYFASSTAGAKVIELSIQSGQEARIRATVPTKMLLVDQRVALVALNDTGDRAAALVRSPHLLALLHKWFDLAWEDSATTTLGSVGGHLLSESQRHVIRQKGVALIHEQAPPETRRPRQ